MNRKKDRHDYDQGTDQYPLDRAIYMLFKNELGFGGTVTELSDTSITVVTRFLGCIDTTVVTGSKEEMLPLLEGVSLFLRSSEEFEEDIFKQTFDDLRNGQDGVTPLLMQIGFGILQGVNRLKAAAMYAFGIVDKETIDIGLRANLEDIFVAMELQQGGYGTFRDALA